MNLPNSRRRALIAPAAFLATLSAASTAGAQMEWTGTMSDSWFVGTNWNPVGPPGGTNDVVIDTVNPNAAVIGLADADAREVTVGDAGIGHLTIRNGNTLNNSNVARIGRLAGADGTVVVTDLGTSWSNGSNLQVGSAGEGHLLITNSAQVSNNQAFVGLFDGGMGYVTVTGAGSVWDNGFDLWVAQTGTGIVNIENGGTVTSPSGFLAQQPAGNGTVMVTGSGSAWTMTGELTVGNNGTGTLIVEDGAVVDVGEVALIGQSGNSQGNVTVTGPGSTWNIGDDLTVGGHNLATANLTIGPGAAVSVGGAVILAEVANPGGCGCVLHVDGSLSSVDGTLINEDSLLTGAGAVGGGATTIAGTVAPGNSVGTLSTRELVFESTAVLEFELDNPGGTNDGMFANGNLTLNGMLHVTDLGGFGEGIYTLIEYTGTLTDNTLAIGSLPAGFTAGIDTSTAGEVRLVVEAQPDDVFSDRFEG